MKGGRERPKLLSPRGELDSIKHVRIHLGKSLKSHPHVSAVCGRLGVGEWDADADKLKAVLRWLCGTFCHWPSGVGRGSETVRMEYLLPLTWVITLSFPFQSSVQ